MKRKAENPELDLTHPALSEERPLFVDNRDGNTLDRALCKHLRSLHQRGALL